MATERVTLIPTLSRLLKTILIPILFKKLNGAGRGESGFKKKISYPYQTRLLKLNSIPLGAGWGEYLKKPVPLPSLTMSDLIIWEGSALSAHYFSSILYADPHAEEF